MIDTNKVLAERLASMPEEKLLELEKDEQYRDIVLFARELRDADLAAKDKCAYYLKKFITRHDAMLEVKKRVTLLSQEDDPVLITGPSGTGKELIANALHGKRAGNFVAINCAGLPEHLIESELFGHVKGAFTDAKTDKVGILEAAKDGTVFLDEIGDMPLVLQAKLLRAIQERVVRKVGATASIEINCRFVSATHRDLLAETQHGTFRNDLYWRISTFELDLMPLIHRKCDIAAILEHLDTERRIKDYPAFIEKEIDFKEDLEGNVRSLQRIVRRYYLFGKVK